MVGFRPGGYAVVGKLLNAANQELWEKTGGRTYKHFVQSYHEDEKITPEQAHRNAIELAENTRAWRGFEVLIATHVDRGHILSHYCEFREL